MGLASSLGFTFASSVAAIEGFLFFLRIMSHAIRPIAPIPPMTAPTAIPALAPVLREAVEELVESLELESDSEVDEAGMEVGVPSAVLRSRSVEEASAEAEVSSVAMVVERVAAVVDRVAVVDVDDSSSDEQVPNMLWHPSPQYVPFLPQYPFAEQQFPNSLPWHVMLLDELAPHDPEVLTSCPSFDAQEPNASWQPSEQ